MVSGFRGRIPKHDAHTHIYTLSKNSVPIMCLALRRSEITLARCESHFESEVSLLQLLLITSHQTPSCSGMIFVYALLHFELEIIASLVQIALNLLFFGVLFAMYQKQL